MGLSAEEVKMLIAPYPPLPPELVGQSEQGEVCRYAPVNGIGQLNPIASIVSPISSIFSTIAAEKMTKEALHAQEAQGAEQKREFDQQTALQKAQLAVQPSQSNRRTQLIALYAIGGLAAAVSAAFLISAARGRKK